MQWLVVASAVVLAGCARAPEPDFAAIEQRGREQRERDIAAMTPDQRAALELATQQNQARALRAQQAAIICSARGQMAAAQPAYGGPGLPGMGAAMVSQEIAGNTVASACWLTYERTGIMPSF